MRRVGIDTGGTFTDCVLVDDVTGSLVVSKVPSVPAAPEQAVARGLASLLGDAAVTPADIDVLVHGTTVATNAVITGRLARAGMITTRGCRDVLEIGTQMRPRLYALHQTPRPALVPRDRRVEVAGRLSVDGLELEALDAGEIAAAVRRLVALDVDAIAIAGLFSYAHPGHEARIEAICREVAPDVYTVRSSAVSAEIREFPRFSTAAVNATIAPLLDRYLGRIEEQLRADGYHAPLFLMQSNGGVATLARSIGGSAHRLVLSGPAAGVLGGGRVAEEVGLPDVVTFDMGGTSADIGIVTGGRPRSRSELRLEGGTPLQMSSLEVEAIGAGGGSIAWVDAGGGLHVGPQSAGAVPGPACYGTGGTEPTVTDAHLVLGRLHPERFLGGAVPLDTEAAERAIDGLARRLGTSRTAAALGVLAVTEANMAGAIRRAAARHGDDLRSFAIVAGGGAGALHGAGLMDALDLTAVCVPLSPGLLSALGLLGSDLRHDVAAAALMDVDRPDEGRLARIAAALAAEATDALVRDGFAPDRRVIEHALDLRYIGQEWSLTIPWTPGERLADVATRFHAEHERAYGHAAPEEPVEVVTARAVGRGRFDRAGAGRVRPTEEPRDERRDVTFADGVCRAATIVQRAALLEDARVAGPAVIEQLDTTTLVPPGTVARVHPSGTLLLERVA